MSECVKGWDDFDADYQILACLIHGGSWSECEERNRFVTVTNDGSIACTYCGHGVEGASYPQGTCDYCGPLLEKKL